MGRFSSSQDKTFESDLLSPVKMENSHLVTRGRQNFNFKDKTFNDLENT